MSIRHERMKDASYIKAREISEKHHKDQKLPGNPPQYYKRQNAWTSWRDFLNVEYITYYVND